jgi:hypothetical protein
MKIFVFLTLLFVFSAALSLANDNEEALLEFRLEVCKYPSVINYLQLNINAKTTNYATEVSEMQKKINTLKVNSQRNQDGHDTANLERQNEIDNLQSKSEQLKLIMFTNALKARDLDVLGKMLDLAYADYLYGKKPTNDDKNDYYIYGVILKLRDISTENPSEQIAYITIPTVIECNLDASIYLNEKKAVSRLSLLGADEAIKEYRRLQAKYGMLFHNFDERKLNLQDRNRIKDLTKTIGAGKKLVNFIKDLENVRLMAKASDTIQDTIKNDLKLSSGSMYYLGVTLHNKIEKNEIDEKLKQFIEVWINMNQKITP